MPESLKNCSNKGEWKYINDASFDQLFEEGLEYSSPARGCWNIVHTGMMIPESHQIFVCALGCLRGVALTAAEINAMDRYSAIVIEEDEVLNGGMEELMIDGVSDILDKLPYRPKAILLFISCQHFFLAYDQKMVFEELRKRYKDIRFLDCYMIPTLRKSGITPDQKMRIQLYKLLERSDISKVDEKRINLIGSNLRIYQKSELVTVLNENGYKLSQISDYKRFEDYLTMADAKFNIVYEPVGIKSAIDLKERLNQEYIYMTFSFDEEELLTNYRNLYNLLELNYDDKIFEKYIDESRNALKKAFELIKDTPIVIDSTFTFRILSLCKRLLKEGFNVQAIYADNFMAEDKRDFEWIRENYPNIKIYATSRPLMRMLNRDLPYKVLALGQKAAYFTNSGYFVNFVEGGGYFGFMGIAKIAELMAEAFNECKDTRGLISQKGYNCERMLL
ncbi:MAG: nitrogenase [Agathobacter sp.]|nr:nitrogenase [Agathobacter sp.]